MNRYLERRIDRRRMRDSRMDYRGRDYANYGSERNGRYDMQSYDYSRGMDYHKQYPEHHRPMEYEMRGIEGIYARPYNDYRSGGDYRGNDYRTYDYNDYGYDYAKESEEYKKDLEKWIEKLKTKDTKFKLKKEQIVNHGKQIGMKFDEISEEEFYATYLMMVSDYKFLGGDPNIYIQMAKDFLMDDDIAVSPSEKLCIYMYEIVMGEKK